MIFKQINNTNIVYENIKDTPRCAIYLYFATDDKIPYNGANDILGSLLLQGTDEKSAETIAIELENIGAEVNIDCTQDYLKVSLVCLNEDIDEALNFIAHFMEKSNFKTFDKEVFKFKGEISALLDSPARKASDLFYRELFKGHKYGITNTKILESIDNMKVDDVKSYYSSLLNGRKIISVAANMDNEENFINNIVNKLPFMKNKTENLEVPKVFIHTNENIYKIVKEDAKQAQIFQGWVTEGLNSDDCAALSVLNNVLGASGLSSRLFIELRDKKGLAYTVRSSYKTLKDAASFVLYIGTEPSNIKKTLDGFNFEIQRIIDEPPKDEELQGAIESYIGKYKYFYTQTNSQIARTNGWSYITGLDFDYNEKLLSSIKNVKTEDIIKVTKKYLFKKPTTVILAPSKYLDF